MASKRFADQAINDGPGQVIAVGDEKHAPLEEHVEHVTTAEGNLIYDDVDEEPELHARTYLAVFAMLMLNMVQVFALSGPPAVLTYIGKSLNATPSQTWILNALSLVQAVLSPVISSASDTFQARKTLLVGLSVISFIGAGIAPGSNSISRLIIAQFLIGFGFAAVPLSYCVPSEILPRRWRPMVQAAVNIAASIASITAPLCIGGFTRSNPTNGWRKFYWIQMALWGVTAICIFVGYRPPKRHTRLDHLSVWQKIRHLDLSGFGLLTSGLTLLLVGLNLGGNLYTWTDARVLATIIIGLIILIGFGAYEWKGTKTGILHHDLFRGGKAEGRTFAICIGLIFMEGIVGFAFIVYYPILTTLLFTKDPFILVVRSMPFAIAGALTTVLWGYASTRLKSIRSPLFFGFLIFTAALVGLATLQPGDSTRALIFAGLAGIGVGAPVVLIIAGVQLSTPHRLIATATAVITSTRAVAVTVFTAIFAAGLNNRLDKDVPAYTAKAALASGLPENSIPAFIEALTSGNTAAVAKVPGVTLMIIESAVAALLQAFADSTRVVWVIAAPFGVLGCIGCFFLGDVGKTMNYRVDAPIEDLHAKESGHEDSHSV